MTLSHPPTIPETDSALDRLNPVERDLLGLLGRGHTAKSIATLRSMSEAAVNERFRSARRKTGIGSSREIARLIVARENRDDFIDLAEADDRSANTRHPDALRRASSQRWRVPLITALLVAAALLAQRTSSPPVIWQDGLAAEILSRQAIDPKLQTMSQTVSSGLRDPNWSSGAEADLADRYNAVANFRRDIHTTSIRCTADLCEVAGIMRSTATGEDLFQLMLKLQNSGQDRTRCRP